MPMVPEPVLEVEAEEEYLDKWVDEFGRWWSRSEVLPGRWFLHDISHGVVWWDELPLHVSVYGGFWMNFCIFLHALFTLGNMVHYFLLALYLAVPRPVSGCCMMNTD